MPKLAKKQKFMLTGSVCASVTLIFLILWFLEKALNLPQKFVSIIPQLLIIGGSASTVTCVTGCAMKKEVRDETIIGRLETEQAFQALIERQSQRTQQRESTTSQQQSSPTLPGSTQEQDDSRTEGDSERRGVTQLSISGTVLHATTDSPTSAGDDGAGVEARSDADRDEDTTTPGGP